ncbi:MAG: GNAT family N-acetyltransferase [Bacteroidetes bacterium]|nr:MAG: GNAT family N-acetyltransferase [Bacteroidota bacterium]
MYATIDFAIPEDRFWADYSDLWHNSKGKPVFQAPSLLQYFIDNSKGVVGIFKCFKEDRLVRFPLKAGDKHIAFVIGLIEQRALIYHSLTYNPDFNKYSPGKVLILFLGEWMKKNNLHILDFGDRNEPYKYSFANKERKLHSVFISGKRDITFILNARLVSFFRSNPALIRFYREKARQWFQRFSRRIFNL